MGTQGGSVQQMAKVSSMKRRGSVTEVLDAIDERGRSALMLAAAEGNMRKVDWLCSQGANKNYVDPQGLTARDHASTAEVTVRLAQDEDVLQAQKQVAKVNMEFNDFEQLERKYEKSTVIWSEDGITIQPVANPHAQSLHLAKEQLHEARSASACNSPAAPPPGLVLERRLSQSSIASDLSVDESPGLQGRAGSLTSLVSDMSLNESKFEESGWGSSDLSSQM